MAGGDEASGAAAGLLGVRGGPVIAAESGTVRGSPFAPRPVCAGLEVVIVGAPQSSSSSCGALLSSSLEEGPSCGMGVVEYPLNDVPLGLHE